MSSVTSWPSPPDPERRRVEQALVAVVCDRGFANATVEGVCDRAGVTTEVYHSHFADLEDGYRHLFEQGSTELLFFAAQAFSAESTWRGQIRAVAHTMYRFIAEDETRGRFLFVEVFGAGEAAMLVRDQGMAGMFELIDQGRNELDDPDSISRATAEGIGGGILQQIRAAVERDELDAFRMKIPQLMYNVVRPYLGEDEARKELALPPPERPSSAHGSPVLSPEGSS